MRDGVELSRFMKPRMVTATLAAITGMRGVTGVIMRPHKSCAPMMAVTYEVNIVAETKNAIAGNLRVATQR